MRCYICDKPAVEVPCPYCECYLCQDCRVDHLLAKQERDKPKTDEERAAALAEMERVGKEFRAKLIKSTGPPISYTWDEHGALSWSNWFPRLHKVESVLIPNPSVPPYPPPRRSS